MTHLFPVDATFYIDNPSVIRRPVDAEKTVSISVCNVKPTLVAFLLFLTTFPPFPFICRYRRVNRPSLYIPSLRCSFFLPLLPYR